LALDSGFLDGTVRRFTACRCGPPKSEAPVPHLKWVLRNKAAVPGEGAAYGPEQSAPHICGVHVYICVAERRVAAIFVCCHKLDGQHVTVQWVCPDLPIRVRGFMWPSGDGTPCVC
jgi:hypothetical protein